MAKHPIIVVGAGIVGVSTAIWLQRFGHRVVLMDRDAPGEGASFGNAGLIAQWAVTPVTTPGLWRDMPNYLINPQSPLFVEWGYLPKMLPWLGRFLAQATDGKTQTYADQVAPLLLDAVDQHRSLIAGTAAESFVRDSKLSYAYRSQAEFEKDAYAWALKRRCGFEPQMVLGADVRDAEPILGPDIGCLAVLEGQGHVMDPGRYVKALAKHFEKDGGAFVRATVQGIGRQGGAVTHVDTDQGRFDCNRLVVTAGIWSKELMQALGLKVQLETERGYHLVFENPSEMPKNPMMHVKGKFGVNPMNVGLRCAGMVELGSHTSGPSDAPLNLLRENAKKAFPTLTYSNVKEWMGFRPSTPDSLPLIGEIENSGIYTGFGHQHVGLTAGPKTGRLLAQMIDKQPPNIQMDAYLPARYLS
ncbi:D-amino-acid dehydrogenase [Cognatiyoonia sediminum]|uniref:D-amino-acid dehydrogenase n=1 Tax=Cognatiyoonia sediminum TaxID=1508389 RepID=A0A1M5SHL9_9RHOB|nr:FAD-binding oxidoreductase [Cognatiyoonia sediminum]SHH38087.1 D-amino-acid dehydrogenase [Cognatiyoonia sediminum]